MAASFYKETHLQIAVASLLDHFADLGYLAWSHPPNEAKRSHGLANRLHSEGMKAGEADCIIYPVNAKAIFIELKRKGNTLNSNQKQRKAYLEARGFHYHVVTASEPKEAQNLVKQILIAEGVIT